MTKHSHQTWASAMSPSVCYTKL